MNDNAQASDLTTSEDIDLDVQLADTLLADTGGFDPEQDFFLEFGINILTA